MTKTTPTERLALKAAIRAETRLKAFRGFVRMGRTSDALTELDIILTIIADARAQTLGFLNSDESYKLYNMLGD